MERMICKHKIFKYFTSSFYFKRVFLLSFFLFSLNSLLAQETPVNPVSYRVFNQFIFNPAITGSKDFFSLEAIAAFQGKYKSQILCANGRIAKPAPAYFSSHQITDFTNIGVGGIVFNDVNDTSKSIGISASAAYHIPLNDSETSFFSFGATVKGVYNKTSPSAFKPGGISRETYFPNADLGFYYYSPRAFAGLSVSNILGNPDTLEISDIPVTREYFLMAGYKFIISRTQNIVLEPSVIINTDDSLSTNFKNLVKPMLKLYVDRVCVGTYFHDYDYFSFFFQYNYPGISIGTYFEYPLGTPYYKKELFAEITVGINLSGKKLRKKENFHW